MSIFGALQSGISGLSAQSSAMGAISDNIVNVNTVGYKGTDTQFKTLVTKQSSNSLYSSGGVQSAPTQQISKPGLLSAVSSSTALGISGKGFFVVNTAANPGDNDMWAFTRAGDFSVNPQGYLQNTGGFNLQGWPLLPYDGNPNASTVDMGGITYMKAYYDTAGNTVYVNDNIIDSRNLKPIGLTSIGGTASATNQISFGANLPSGDPIYNPSNSEAGGRHSVSALIYDSLGNASNMSLTYTKTSANGWDMSTSIPKGASSVTLTGTSKVGNTAPDIYGAMGQLEFTSIPANGSQVTINGITYTFANGGGADTATNKFVDLDGVLSVSDFTKAFASKIQSSAESANRFQADGNRILITQSTMGQPINIDCSKTTGCTQSSANPDPATGLPSGQFTIDAVSDNIKNGARLQFSTVPANGNTITLGGQTYNFVDTLTPGNTNEVLIVAGDLQSTLKNLQAQINSTAKEPSRFVISGSTLEILPTGSGGDITFSTNFNGVSGVYRDPTNGWITLDGATPLNAQVNAQFNANGLATSLEEGSLVPAVRFNADGTPKYFYADAMDIQWANGAQDMSGQTGEGNTIKLFAGNIGTSDGLTSLAGKFTTNYVKQDGAKFGTYAGVSIDKTGVVTALFDNGETRPIAILPLATFASPEGMQSLNGNSWIATDYSGDAVLNRAGSNGSGEIASESLELSTVDLATEFSNMIITQRAYSASTKIITTANQMLQELTSMI